jgi:hypothetical protein
VAELVFTHHRHSDGHETVTVESFPEEIVVGASLLVGGVLNRRFVTWERGLLTFYAENGIAVYKQGRSVDQGRDEDLEQPEAQWLFHRVSVEGFYESA